MKISKGIVTVRDKVEQLLFEFDVLRDNDMLLWLAYLNRYHKLRELIGEANYQVLKNIILDSETPKFESIRRSRQKIQEAGVYQGKFRDERLGEQENVKDIIRGS